MKNKTNSKTDSSLSLRTFMLSLLLCMLLLVSQILMAPEETLAQGAPVPPVPPAAHEPPSAQKPSKLKRVLKRFKEVITPGDEATTPQIRQAERPATQRSASPSRSVGYGEQLTPNINRPVVKKPVQHVVRRTKDGYLLAVPGYQFKFPRDHASHPQFKTEWWYYTGHLLADDGSRYGYEVTFFRSGVPTKNPPKRSLWQLKDIYAAHFAVSDLNRERFVFAERLNRNSPYSGAGLAQADTNRFYVLNDTWGTWKIAQATTFQTMDMETLETKLKEFKAASKDGTAQKKPAQHFWLQADMTESDQKEKRDRYRLALQLTPEKIPVIHGKNGVSQKASCVGCASHYYSFTRLATDGTIWVDGKPKHVTGLSWMDREFGSNQLTSQQTGWDWFSIQLDNNTELMLYVLRNERKEKGKTVQFLDPNSSGTIYFANGKARHLKKSDFQIKATGSWRSQETKANYPMGWQVNIPAYKLELFLSPSMRNQELVTHQSTRVAYWEGANKVKGTMNGKAISGQAYVEMTGYAQKFRQRI